MRLNIKICVESPFCAKKEHRPPAPGFHTRNLSVRWEGSGCHGSGEPAHGRIVSEQAGHHDQDDPVEWSRPLPLMVQSAGRKCPSGQGHGGGRVLRWATPDHIARDSGRGSRRHTISCDMSPAEIRRSCPHPGRVMVSPLPDIHRSPGPGSRPGSRIFWTYRTGKGSAGAAIRNGHIPYNAIYLWRAPGLLETGFPWGNPAMLITPVFKK